MHALERMRLQDMAEIQDLAKQLHQSRQELWNTRETLGAERARTEQGQQGPYLPLPSARPTPARSYPQVALG